MKYLALLRGINVGGKNIIHMTDLKSCFEKMHFDKVSTYIQSGNVLFSSDVNDKNLLCKTIESELSRTFNYESKIVLISAEEFKLIMNEAPKDFGSDIEKYKYDVVFIREPLTAAEVFSVLKFRDGVDAASYGTHALYFTRLTELSSRSYLSKLASHSIYKELSVRNFNTTCKLSEMINNL